MVRPMDRSLTKFLYEYLPENTFNHANIPISGRIKYLEESYDDDGELSIAKSHVINRVRQQFYRWPNSEELLEQDLFASVDIIVPGYAKYHLYPRTFECPNCGMFIQLDREDETNISDRDTDELLSCDYCGTRIGADDQLPFVAICECGAITELWAPSHKHNDNEWNMKLSRPTTSMSDWQWECIVPGCEKSIPFMATSVKCPNPACSNDDLTIVNHTDSKAFYPQSVDFINLQDEQSSSTDQRYRARIISDYILEDKRQKPSDKEIRQKAADLAGGPHELISLSEEEHERKIAQARSALTADHKEHRKKIREWLDGTSKSEREKTNLTEECYEYLSLVEAEDYAPADRLQRDSFAEFADNPDDTHIDTPTIEHYQNLTDELNLRRLHLINNIPITTVTYGYTRIQPDADAKSMLRMDSLSDSDSTDPETEPETEDSGESSDEEQMNVTPEAADEVQLNMFTTKKDPYPTFYARENHAEGVFIELSHERVLDWLETNGVITEAERPSADKARMWLLNAVRTPKRYETLADLDTQAHLEPNTPAAVARHVYALVNSYAHAFINAIAVLGGQQRESLIERVMPHTLSFLVYKQAETDQTFGTVLTLFEERFDDFVDQFHEQSQCPLDEVCYHDENGACEHCLYLPAMSTENTNHNLSRAMLFGGQFDEGKLSQSNEEITGFLKI